MAHAVTPDLIRGPASISISGKSLDPSLRGGGEVRTNEVNLLKSAILLVASLAFATIFSLVALLAVSLVVLYTCDPMTAESARPSICSRWRPWDEFWYDRMQTWTVIVSFFSTLLGILIWRVRKYVASHN